jgi:DNA-binding transcriptional MerR regulator
MAKKITENFTLLNSYSEASERTGIAVETLRRWVDRRQIRVIKGSDRNLRMFRLEHLLEDISKMEVPTIRA